MFLKGFLSQQCAKPEDILKIKLLIRHPNVNPTSMLFNKRRQLSNVYFTLFAVYSTYQDIDLTYTDVNVELYQQCSCCTFF